MILPEFLFYRLTNYYPLQVIPDPMSGIIAYSLRHRKKKVNQFKGYSFLEMAFPDITD